MTKRVEPEIPSITLDIDQVETFKNTRKSTNRTGPKTNDSQNVSNNSGEKIKSSSSLNTFAVFILYITVAGSIWWFYQENIKLQNHLSTSQQRIELLEQQLSATGEEMGESEVAMKVRLEGLTEKTNKLWQEMDKLWASAWRRNQSEIKEIRSKALKQSKTATANNKKLNDTITKVTTSVSKFKEKQTSTEFNINLLSDQIAAANNAQTKIKKLASKFAALEEKSSSRDQQQMKVATNVNQLEKSLKLLREQLIQLEANTAENPQANNTLPINNLGQ
ncbi:MAG: hypothetical protein HRT38_04970 [Alteromonadaceae bacterium]|nr:hypothetical protein [Alteromonadaceae bacterium]